MISIETLQALVDFKKYNAFDFVKLYPFQKDFINAGSKYLQRAFCGANRCGKTHLGAYEMACHLTGRYPEWWQGYRVDVSGQQFAIVGITQQSARKILQEKLFGTNDCRDNKAMGTGMLPRDAIVFEPMEKDGPRIVSAQIKHIDGGTNTVFFFGASQEKDIMGMTLKGVWIDETDKTQCGPLYDQCNTRVMTTNGFIFQTFTPENGFDDVVTKFVDANESGSDQLYLKMASMYEAHVNVGGHITDEMIERIKAGSPEFMWDCRIHGIPSAGIGKVFTIADEAITEAPVKPQPHWSMVAGIDFGIVNDPSTVIFVMMDDDGVIHLADEIYLDDDRSPRAIADAIKASPYPNVLTVVPHDAGLNSDDPQAKGKLLIEYGINVLRQPFRNPVDVKLGIDELKSGASNSYNSKAAGLIEMQRRFEEGTLKVSSQMFRWLREKQTYFYKSKGGGYKPVDKDDHCIDASRYAVMSLIGNHFTTVSEAMGATTRRKQLTPSFRI